MDYIGELLLPGQLGHFFIVLSFVASLVATFAYFMQTASPAAALAGQGSRPAVGWRTLARAAFVVETLSVIAIFSILFYIIYNHRFEYHYAWKHSSRSLEFKYLLACFWEGQEGSFLLWSFWHCMLGLLLMRSAKSWEAPVMTIISFAQLILATMVAGIYLFGHKIGSNPFILLRNTDVFANAPAFYADGQLRADYLTLVKDGNDLNPLLQNRWMVIHPPVLFLGFASTIIPFAFAIAGLWTKKIGTWVNAALPWALFSSAVFGVGIMMGAWWAYESLNFGGYWAWDPVENASLVPWLILVAGIHTLLIYKHSGYSLRASYLFLILTFVFVLYSTFLTRSGILGEASVHAFTDLGMNVQLFLFLYIFIWLCPILAANTFNKRIITAFLGIVLGLASYFLAVPGMPLIAILAGIILLVVFIQQQVPAITREEHSSSREFWMFIGSLVFFLSALVITAITSLPVFNALFGINKAAPEKEELLYNKIHVLVAVIVALLTAVTQYLKYKKTPVPFFWKRIAVPTVIAAVITSLVLAFGNINYEKEGLGFLIQIWVAVAASIYAIVANAAYIWIGIKGNPRLSGGSLAHVGFGMVLLGILLSSSKKEILSYNTSGIPVNFGENSTEKTGENLTLVKGLPMKMGAYDVTYRGDSIHPKKQQWYFQIDFRNRETNEAFTLWPDAFVNYKGNEGLMASPASRHYLTHDIFTYISALPNPEKNKDTAQFVSHESGVGDTIFYSRGYMILDQLSKPQGNIPVKGMSPGDSAMTAQVSIHSFTRSNYTTDLLLIKSSDGQLLPIEDTIMAESLVLRLNKVEGRKAEIGVKESNTILEYVTLKAYKFPYINLLWAGIVVTAIGIFISMAHRIRLNRVSAR